MRILRFSFKNSLHNKRQTLLNLLICIATVVLLNIFVGNIVSINRQINKLAETIEVKAYISNLCGSLNAGLKIKEHYVDDVKASEYIIDPVFSVQLKMGFGEFGVEDYLGNLNYFVAGGNAMAAIPGLHEEELNLEEGMSSEKFFSSNERLCLIDEGLFEDQGLAIGDEVVLTGFYYRYGFYHDIYLDPLDSGNYRIVGTYNILEYTGDGVRPDMLLPFEAVRSIFHEKGIEFTADSGSFVIKDPHKLNEFKKEMHDIGFLPVSFNSEFQYDGNALTVKDDTFIRAAEQLVKNSNLLKWILPFLGVGVLCIGFIMAQLLMKGRIAEYAIMRSLGQSYRESFQILCMEYGLTALIGSLCGALVGIFVFKTFWLAAVIVAFAFFICYVMGTAMALRTLNKLSIMTVLSKND